MHYDRTELRACGVSEKELSSLRGEFSHCCPYHFFDAMLYEWGYINFCIAIKLKTVSNLNQKCEDCGEDLKPSQYASRKNEGNLTIKDNEDLVCRNYPDCEKAEKEV
jgi:hypothetical protein